MAVCPAPHAGIQALDLLEIGEKGHRVVGADGRLTGYAGGLWRKRWLLAHESGQLTLDL